MTKYGIIPDYLHCLYRDHKHGVCTHPDVQKPGYLKVCVESSTQFVAYKDGKKIDFPEDCPLKDTPPEDADSLTEYSTAIFEHCIKWCMNTGACPPACPLYKYQEEE